VRLPEVPGVEHRFVQAGGLRVHVAEAGSGPPVVLLHGWPQHWWMWRALIPRLAEGHRVLAPDLRGHGWSDVPPGGYDKEQFATDLLATLDALGLDEPVVLVGHDWGAWSGFLACVRAPERFRGFVACSVPHLWLSPRDALDPRRVALQVTYQSLLGAPFLGERLIRGGVVRLMLRSGRRHGSFSPQEIEAYQEVLRDPARAHASATLYRTFLFRETPAIARGRYAKARLEVPTRLVVGQYDPIVRRSRLDGYERNAPDLTIERVPDTGHFLPEERPEVVIRHTLALSSR
jgi:pimeloyl-ACP methyl ester carboxylesterase